MSSVAAAAASTTTTTTTTTSGTSLNGNNAAGSPKKADHVVHRAGLKRKLSLDASTPHDHPASEQEKTAVKRPKAAATMAANTIMITNNYSKNGVTPTTTTTTSNSSKITIVAHNGDADHPHPHRHHRPMVVDQINICINNHFTADAITTTARQLPDLIQSIQQQKPAFDGTSAPPKGGYEPGVVLECGLTNGGSGGDGGGDDKARVISGDVKLEPVEIKAEPLDIKEEQPSEDEDTLRTAAVTSECYTGDCGATGAGALVVGDEVLVPKKTIDDCYYLGVVAAVKGNKCLVQFGDNTGCWAYADKMRRVARPPDTFYCVICKARNRLAAGENDGGGAGDRRECELCGRAYHGACLEKELDQQGLRDRRPAKGSGGLDAIDCLRCIKRSVEEEMVTTMSSSSSSLSLTRKEKSAKHSDRRRSGAESQDNKVIQNITGNFYPFSQLLETKSWFSAPPDGTNTATGAGVTATAATTSTSSAACSSASSAAASSVASKDTDDDDDDAASEESKENPYFNCVNGRRLRKRQEKKNYADNAKRPAATFPSTATSATATSTISNEPPKAYSCSSSSSSSSSSSYSSSFASGSLFSLSNLFSADFFSRHHHHNRHHNQHRSQSRFRRGKRPATINNVPYESSVAATSAAPTVASAAADAAAASTDCTVVVKPSLNAIFETRSRLARGEKYVIRGKRTDQAGNVQYLVEWEGLLA